MSIQPPTSPPPHSSSYPATCPSICPPNVPPLSHLFTIYINISTADPHTYPHIHKSTELAIYHPSFYDPSTHLPIHPPTTHPLTHRPSAHPLSVLWPVYLPAHLSPIHPPTDPHPPSIYSLAKTSTIHLSVINSPTCHASVVPSPTHLSSTHAHSSSICLLNGFLGQ